MKSKRMIGVGITVHNRHNTTDKTLRNWYRYLPKDAVLVVVDDASDTPYIDSTFRFENNVGIAKAKNKCLELLEDQKVTDYFLADNDCYPVSFDWWRPYVESPEPHLSYQFLDLKSSRQLNDIKEIYRDNKHVAYTGQRGCLLYYKKSVLDTVGGFDPIYGRALYEHSDLANRIHSAGLTTWRYADVVGSEQLWHSMDEHVEVTRTVPQEEQSELVRKNMEIHHKRRLQGYQAFVPYREDRSSHRDIVMTTLLTANPDPQRGVKWEPDAKNIAPWLESLDRGEWEGVVIADEMKSLPDYYTNAVVESVQSSSMNVYYQRWLHIYQYLRDHPEVRWVWCTDGSDVEIMRDPFDKMAPGKLYVGTEPHRVDDPWMTTNHPARYFEKLFKQFGSSTLLNAGVVGGDRLTVQELAQKIVTLHDDIASERFWKADKSVRDLGDMAAFNYVCYFHFRSRLVYGPEVTTEFKAYKDNGTARFKHK